jgi:hypothetical protein
MDTRYPAATDVDQVDVEHPWWCDRSRCRVTEVDEFAEHRSAATVIPANWSAAEPEISAWLALPGVNPPGDTWVVVRVCDQDDTGEPATVATYELPLGTVDLLGGVLVTLAGHARMSGRPEPECAEVDQAAAHQAATGPAGPVAVAVAAAESGVGRVTP